MKASLVCLAAVLVVGSMSAAAQQGAAVSRKPAVQSSDQALDTRIAKRINSDPSLKKYKIKVAVDSGVATLTGTVATEADRGKAADLAKVPGITRVDNQIVVDLDAGTRAVRGTAGTIQEKTKEGAEKAKEGTGKAIDKSQAAAEKAIEKTKEGVSKTGEVITDSWITTRVKTKFVGEDLLKDSEIHVTTDNHVVTLTGTVPTAAGRARAVELAKSIEGVKRVNDRLAIGPKTP
jgi:hyperosmotically inducible protein